jgi:hypothetical protein
MWSELKHILTANGIRILLTYSLMLIEFFICALYPLLIGIAIDSLLANRGYGFVLFLVSSVMVCILGVMRRMIDTRTFSYIWVTKAKHSIISMIRANIPSSSIISRGHLQTTYGDFLEYTIPTVVSAAIDVMTAAIILSTMLLYVTTAAIMGVCLIVYAQVKISAYLMTLDRIRQQCAESCDKAVVERSEKSVIEAYDEVPRIMVKRSDIEAIGWAFSDLIAVIFSVIVIMECTSNQHSVGEIITAVAYIRQIFFKTSFISFLLSHMRQMKLSEELSQQDICEAG